MKNSVIGLAAILSTFALACGDDTGTGGSATTGTTVTSSGASTKAATATATGTGTSTKASGTATTATGSSGTGGGMSFAVNLGPGWPHVGAKHEAVIVVNGNVVQKVEATGAATTTFQFSNIPAGAAVVNYYADVDGNMACSAPPADHVWTQNITVDGEDKTFAHDANWMDVCNTFQ